MERNWFITGASSGFGRALAETVLERGDCVTIGARRIDVLEQLASRHPGRALAVALDVTNETQRKSALEAALRRFGRIDVLANIAGRDRLGPPRSSRPSSFGSRWK